MGDLFFLLSMELLGAESLHHDGVKSRFKNVILVRNDLPAFTMVVTILFQKFRTGIEYFKPTVTTSLIDFQNNRLDFLPTAFLIGVTRRQTQHLHAFAGVEVFQTNTIGLFPGGTVMRPRHRSPRIAFIYFFRVFLGGTPILAPDFCNVNYVIITVPRDFR